jgi:hypothetical protein
MTPDHLLAATDREEALSRAYVQTVAAGAGYLVATRDFDRDGIDCEIKAGGHMRPALGIQLKATVTLGECVEGCYRYPLKRRNYDWLRGPSQTPRILVVLALPEQETDWLSISAAELVLRRCAYWVSLVDAPETTNQTSVTVRLPEVNRLDTESLRRLMDQSRTGVIR